MLCLFQECNRCRCASNGAGWLCTRRLCDRRSKRAPMSRDRNSVSSNHQLEVNHVDGEPRLPITAYSSNKFKFSPERKILNPSTAWNQVKSTTTLESSTPLPTSTERSKFFRCSTKSTKSVTSQRAIVGSTTTNYKETTPSTPETSSISSDQMPAYTESDLEKADFACEPKKAFKLDCNICWCTNNGKGAKSCTRIACNATRYEPLK